jgi:hypothetical protein
LPAAGPVVEFGEWKGRPIVALTTDEKQAAIRYGEWCLEQNPRMKAKVKDALTGNVEAIRSSMAPAPAVEEAEVVDEKSVPISHEHAEPPPGMATGERQPGSEG